MKVHGKECWMHKAPLSCPFSANSASLTLVDSQSTCINTDVSVSSSYVATQYKLSYNMVIPNEPCKGL